MIVIVIVLGLGTVVLMAMQITRPITQISNAIADIASGNLDTTVPHTGKKDEIGEIARL